MEIDDKVIEAFKRLKAKPNLVKREYNPYKDRFNPLAFPVETIELTKLTFTGDESDLKKLLYFFMELEQEN